ncbi:hypothetical protein ACFL6X_04310, partial [Candidatus Latescibacterota bacterium]
MFGSSMKGATGIHLADGALHIVELAHGKSGTVLQRVLRLAVGDACRLIDLTEADRRAEVVEALRRARRDFGVRFQRPFFALDGQSVFLKRRPVVSGNQSETRDLLRWEAEQFLADELDEYAVDYLLTRRHGFIVAARRSAVALAAAVLEEADIAKPGFDIIPFSLCNAVELGGSLSDRGVAVLVHLGAE